MLKDSEYDNVLASGKESCKGHIELADILEKEVGEMNIFFIETSEKTTITSREACSLESAARYR